MPVIMAITNMMPLLLPAPIKTNASVGHNLEYEFPGTPLG